jgi:hypothetical protein
MSRAALLVLGVFLAIAASAAAEPRDSVSRDFPLYENGGLADLTVDPKRFVSQMEIIDRFFDPDSCELVEGSVGGSGYRRILRFDTVLINAGDGDLVVGDPTDPANPYADIFEFSPCHGHFHITGFADYRLETPGGGLAAPGHKQAFCFISSFKYSNDFNGQDKPNYSCADQGIALGYGDWYYKQLSGQWIDITGVPEGDYVVRVEINAAGTFDEGEDRYTNVVTTTIHVPNPRNKVSVDSSSLTYGP